MTTNSLNFKDAGDSGLIEMISMVFCPGSSSLLPQLINATEKGLQINEIG